MNQIKIIKNNNKKGNKFSIQVSIKIKAALIEEDFSPNFRHFLLQLDFL
jgi:hypothetical protein